ncbi:carbohydrate-binding module family 50 protein [Biscogniauxia sp. FL1348]|nr:carbohydrate-binding module family 50 protein [Biscogniauxia sp. FL1348]
MGYGDQSYQGGEAQSYYNSQYAAQQQPGYGNGPQYGNQSGPQGAEGDRGLMGAVAGGAAGGFGGHKMGHGVLGAVGGAIAGHLAEEFIKDKREEHHQQSNPPPAYSSGSGYQSHHEPTRDRGFGGGGGGGNFSATSHDIYLEGGNTLRAVCQRAGSGTQVSYLNLDRVLSNEDGHFRWMGGGGGGMQHVTVQQGDTLRDIARRFHCSFEEIARVNNLANPDMIFAGQNLQIPIHSGGNFSASARDIRLVDGGRVLEAELRTVRGGWNRSHINLDERIGNRDGELYLV